MSLTGPLTSSQTHTFKPRLIFKDLVLEILVLALEEVDLVIEGEDDVLHGLAIHLEITGNVRDHKVISIEPTLHHPLAPEDFLLLQPHGRRCLADEDREEAGGAYEHHQRGIEYRVWALPLASAKLGGGAPVSYHPTILLLLLILGQSFA